MSFGFNFDRGWGHTYYCVPASEEDTADLIRKETERQSRGDAARRVEEIAKSIQKSGQHPSGEHRLQGKRILIVGERNIPYGGGSWFVIEPNAIWFIRNNGADGDNWSHNNVLTGGAGAIGWKVPYDASLAAEMEGLYKVLGDR